MPSQFLLVVTGLFLSLPLTAGLAWGHGEDIPGPHGGHIRMPGAFHTELVAKSDQEVNVYLLDISFKNPTTEGSTLSAVFKANAKETALACEPKTDHYVCTAPKGTALKSKGEIVVTANRSGKTGGPAVYPLPLQFSR